MIKIAVAGAHGRVGKRIVEAIHADPETTLAASIMRLEASALKNVHTPVDVLIDFSTTATTMAHLNIAIERGYRMVIGVTGFTEIQKNDIRLAARHIPIVLSENTSIGVNVCYKLLALAAGVLKEREHIAIIDIHHKDKKDAPSGTALKMAEVIHQAQEKTNSESAIAFSSLRMGDTIAEITAMFALEGERLEITHRATDRAVFAKGALQAAKWLMTQTPGLYDMQDVLGLQ